MSKHKEEKGYVLVTVAALLVVFLGFAALGIDVGVLYSSRTAAQSAADAAALAGAFSFVSNPFAPQPDTAYDHAMSTALANRIMGTPVTEAEVSVNVDVGSRRVIVDIDRNESTYFARALGVTRCRYRCSGRGRVFGTSRGSLLCQTLLCSPHDLQRSRTFPV